MQPQFILATLLAGFAAAQIDDGPTHFCPKGQGKLQTGPLCIGDNNQSLGPAKECPIVVCNRQHFCDLIPDENGCMVCPPGYLLMIKLK
ncbi:hypothetical protein NHJ13734_006352 [Beauveria thailandica]